MITDLLVNPTTDNLIAALQSTFDQAIEAINTENLHRIRIMVGKAHALAVAFLRAPNSQDFKTLLQESPLENRVVHMIFLTIAGLSAVRVMWYNPVCYCDQLCPKYCKKLPESRAVRLRDQVLIATYRSKVRADIHAVRDMAMIEVDKHLISRLPVHLDDLRLSDYLVENPRREVVESLQMIKNHINTHNQSMEFVTQLAYGLAILFLAHHKSKNFKIALNCTEPHLLVAHLMLACISAVKLLENVNKCYCHDRLCPQDCNALTVIFQQPESSVADLRDLILQII